MARLFMSGWEMPEVLDGTLWDSTSGTALSVTLGAARSGVYGLRYNADVPTAGNLLKQFSTAGTQDMYLRVYLKIITSVTSSWYVLDSRDNPAAGRCVGIRVTSTNTLQLMNSAGQIGSDSSALTANQWYRIEIGYDLATQTATGYIDGVSFASGAVTAAYDNPTIAYIGAGSSTGDLYLDDFALNDNVDDGSSETGLPGAGQIVQLLPNAAGDNAMGSRGGTDSGSDWDQLNEAPPNDATDYYILDVDNDIIDVNIQPATLYMNSYDTINVVQVCARHTAGGVGSFAYAARIKSQASGTVATGGTKTHDDTTWRTNGDAAPRLPSVTSYTDPQLGGAWTPALLDTAQIGVICTDATPDLWITSLWALVDYETGTPPASNTDGAYGFPCVAPHMRVRAVMETNAVDTITVSNARLSLSPQPKVRLG